MIRHFILTAVVMMLAFSAGAQNPAFKKGVLDYTIDPSGESTRKALITEYLEVSYRMSVGSTDSILNETFTGNQRLHIPVNHPSFKDIFTSVSKGDRVTIIINADSFYKYTMNTALPYFIKRGDSIVFYFKIYEVMNDEMLYKRQNELETGRETQDSVAFARHITFYNRVNATPSGLRYVVSATGTGKQAAAGNRVTIKYKGYFMDGKVFENNPEGFTFILGAGQVIAGWDEGIALMREGARFKFIIPQRLAYGAAGNSTIPPYTSLVFDVELVKVD